MKLSGSFQLACSFPTRPAVPACSRLHLLSAGIVREFAAAVLTQHEGDLQSNIAGPPDPVWLYDLVMRQLLASACRRACCSRPQFIFVFSLRF